MDSRLHVFEVFTALFSCVWYRLDVCQHLASVRSFTRFASFYVFSFVGHKLHFFLCLEEPVTGFPHLAPVTCFPRAWNQEHVSPRLASATCVFPIGTGYMFSRTWRQLQVLPLLTPAHQLYILPRLAPVTCSPLLSTSHMFSRALEPVTCSPARGTSYMFARACHQLQVFPRFTPVTCFPVLCTSYMFSRAV